MDGGKAQQGIALSKRETDAVKFDVDRVAQRLRSLFVMETMTKALFLSGIFTFLLLFVPVAIMFVAMDVATGKPPFSGLSGMVSMVFSGIPRSGAGWSMSLGIGVGIASPLLMFILAASISNLSRVGLLFSLSVWVALMTAAVFGMMEAPVLATFFTAHWALTADLALTLGLLAWVYLEMAPGAWAVLAMNREERKSLRANATGKFWSTRSFRRFFGIPTLFDIVKKDRVQAYLLFLLATYCFFSSSWQLFGGTQSYMQNLRWTLMPCQELVGAAKATCIGDELTLNFWVRLVVQPLAVIGFAALGGVLLTQARKLNRISANALRETDPRAPILFLRPFVDDQVALAPARLSPMAWLLEIGRRKETLDGMLLEEGAPYGPVLAIGNPNDKLPPFGAARAYLSNADWKTAVTRLAEESSAIVLCVDGSPGVAWELDHVVASGHLPKTLLVVPPRTDPALRGRIAERLMATGQFEESNRQELASPDLIGVFRAGETWRPALSKRPDKIAYLALVRWFLHRNLGAPVYPPRRKPLWRRIVGWTLLIALVSGLAYWGVTAGLTFYKTEQEASRPGDGEVLWDKMAGPVTLSAGGAGAGLGAEGAVLAYAQQEKYDDPPALIIAFTDGKGDWDEMKLGWPQSDAVEVRGASVRAVSVIPGGVQVVTYSNSSEGPRDPTELVVAYDLSTGQSTVEPAPENFGAIPDAPQLEALLAEPDISAVEINDSLELPNGVRIVAAHFYPYNVFSGSFSRLIAFDQDKRILWTRRVVGPDKYAVHDLAVLNNGDLLLSGQVTDYSKAGSAFERILAPTHAWARRMHLPAPRAADRKRTEAGNRS